jgi:hydroxymethylpyrimidine pyrophosphatase-like HAD family hydrolase
MRYQVIATDYDGTLATGGTVDQPVLDALTRARRAGMTTLLVTGRELTDLFNAFTRADLFDRIVAENGGVLFEPATGRTRVLGEAPPPSLIEALTARRVPISVGRSIVATVEPWARTLSEEIRRLRLDWHIVTNKGSLMALPSGVSKATGLSAALLDLHASTDSVAGIGDAENDLAFLRICGLSVAVSNAVAVVKREATLVLDQPRGAGVIALIGILLDDADTPARSPAAPT